MKTISRVLGFLLVAPLVFTAASATAQQTPYAVNRFDPAEKGSDWFANESLDLRGKFRPAIGVLGDLSTRQIEFKNPDGSREGSLVGTQFFVHVGASLTLFDRLRLGVNAPFALYQDGSRLAFNNGGTSGTFTTYNPPGKAAVGDVRVGADLRIVGEYKDPFTLAIGVQVHTPTGVTSQYTGDGSSRIVPRIMMAGDIGDFAYAIRGGYEISGRDGDTFVDTRLLGNAFTGGLAVGVRGFSHHLLIGPELYGSTLSKDPFKGKTSPAEALIGMHYAWSDWKFGLGAGGGINDSFSSPAFRLVGGIEWSPAIEEPKPTDRDGDGIDDDHDACPDVAGIKTDDPKTNGCPPPPGDRDGDGIIDADDACPDVAGVKTDDPKTNGCPPDKDKDGIIDSEDACPDVAGVKTDDPKTNGCPPDKDKDGIIDSEDACPDVAGVKTDDPKTNGCPPDRDGDGILDADDACPDKPGVKDPDPKKNGCPPLAMISNGQIKISEQVQFKTGSAEILKVSDTLLNAVLAIIQAHPEIKHLHIEGHTDNVGKAAMNKTLSDKRAKSVMAWLQLKGVDKGRMDAKGYGMDRPIDTNSTPEGRQNNRRVEFHIDEN